MSSSATSASKNHEPTISLKLDERHEITKAVTDAITDRLKENNYVKDKKVSMSNTIINKMRQNSQELHKASAEAAKVESAIAAKPNVLTKET